MASYLVTGGLGFIGSHLVDRLVSDGHRVRVLDDLSVGRRENLSAGAELVVGSITDAALVQDCMADVDGCFHLAAVAAVQRCTEEWLSSHRVNSGGTVTVFEASARRAGGPVPVVYASSAAVYGDGATVPLSEDCPVRPLTAYGADKLAAELNARVAGLVHGVPSFGLRPFNVYGPRQDPKSPYSGVISIFADRARRGEDLTILGDGQQTRDFVYVADMVEILVAGIRAAHASAPVVNVCTGRAVTIKQLAETVIAMVGSASRIIHGAPRLGDIRFSCGDPSSARARTGISAQGVLEECLGQLLD